MNSKAIPSVLLMLFSTSVITGCLGSQSTSSRFNQANWPTHCLEMKAELLKSPEASNVIYQPRPDQPVVQNSWELTWFDQRIPIPAIAYSEVKVSRSEQEESLLVLLKGHVDDQNISIALGRSKFETSIEDAFSTFSLDSDGNEAQGTEEGKALTKEIFGGPINVAQLIDLGYQYTLEELSCDRDQWKEEVPIALGIMLKSVAGPGGNSSAVYAIPQGEVIQRKAQKTTGPLESWQAQWSEEGVLTNVMIHIPEQQTYGELGLGIGQTTWQAKPNQPQWLIMLETAIAQPSSDNWQAFTSALEQAGLSEKSIQSH